MSRPDPGPSQTWKFLIHGRGNWILGALDSGLWHVNFGSGSTAGHDIISDFFVFSKISGFPSVQCPFILEALFGYTLFGPKHLNRY